MRQIEELRYLILAAQRDGERMLNDILRPMGLTPSQSEVLRVLFDHEPLSTSQLGGLLVCETGSPSRLVNRLVVSGHVEQKPSTTDSRKVSLTLTPLGRDAVAKIVAVEEEVYASFENNLLKGAPISEFIDLLWKIVDGKPAGEALARRKKQK